MVFCCLHSCCIRATSPRRTLGVSEIEESICSVLQSVEKVLALPMLNCRSSKPSGSLSVSDVGFNGERLPSNCLLFVPEGTSGDMLFSDINGDSSSSITDPNSVSKSDGESICIPDKNSFFSTEEEFITSSTDSFELDQSVIDEKKGSVIDCSSLFTTD